MIRSRFKTGTLLVVLLAATITGASAATVEEFGETIARTLQEGDADGFTALVDKDTLADRALSGMKGGDDFVSEVRKGLHMGLSQVGAVLTNNMGPDARVSYVRARTVDGVSRVLVRLDLGDRGLNYLDFFVHEPPDGSWQVFDWLDYVQGQAYTSSLRMALAFTVSENPSLMHRLLGLPEVDSAVVQQIGEMGKLSQRNEWVRWLEIYETLPARVRHSRVMLAGRVAAAATLDSMDDYMSAMADLHTHHGDDPTLSLALVDYYILTGDYDSAYRAVDRLEHSTGGDAAVTNLRSGIALYAGDNATSIRHARQAISEDPDYENPYWNLMTAGSRAGDFKTAMEGVLALQRRFGYELSEDALMASGEFSGLLASEEWKSAN